MHNSFKKNLKIVFKKTSLLKNFFSSNQANGFIENYFKQNVVSKCFQQHFPLNKTKMASFIVTRQFYKVPI